MTDQVSGKNSDSSATIQNTEREPIAIIGIGCRYPGGANDPQTLWQLLINGVDAITEIPADRVDVAPYYDPILAAPGKIASSQGGFLDKVDQFDSYFFGVSPREANYMDPQQRLLLETTWEALEDAGQIPENLKESQTGVFIGMWANDYTEKMYKATEDINLYITTGGGRYAASGRLSYFFGFNGPSMTVDTACSSSLVTVHLACQSLREGESTLAIAGGVNLILEPSISIGYSRSKMLSPDGRCKFGDVRANGYVRSEGVGVVVLKRLSQALNDKDHIYAVIRGSAVNNDGRSSELLVAPGVGSQIKMLREAYQNAGVDPSQVGYVEAHGTGTPVGDPVELEALGTVLSDKRDASHALRIGSIKTNIGHTESASGVAGLIKTALILQHKAIPPSLHFKEPNPKIPWKDLHLQMQTELTPWPDEGGPAFAAVNSFGITGTNAHIVLEEAPKVSAEPFVDHSESSYLLPLSAQTPEALHDLVGSYSEVLNKLDDQSIHSICYTASCHRTHHAQRLAVVGSSAHELVEQLSLYVEQKPATDQPKIDKHAKVAFVFPGQGAQWVGMGRELLKQNAVFCDVLTQCDQAIRNWADWSLLEQLSLDENSPAYRLNEISVIQPALFAMEVALAKVWMAWGVEPSAVIGHSMGEVAAAYIAGALTLDDAAHIICKRSQLMQRTSGQGAMAVIGLPIHETEKVLKDYQDKLSVAVQNSPKSTVVSGEPAALQTLMTELQSKEIFCRLIKVDVASHSPQMDPIRSELVESLQGIQPNTTSIPFYSTVMQHVCDGGSLDAEYWGRNLRQPVLFSNAVDQLLEDEHVIFIEMSPHPVLLSSIEETRSQAEKIVYGFASLRRDQPELGTLLGELGALYRLGYNVDWNKLYPTGGEMVSLPTYPWQRDRYWFEATATSKQTRPGAHPLLGQYIRSATGQHIWETTLSTKLLAYLNDHQVRGSAVFPAAGYVEMVLAAAEEIHGAQSHHIQDIEFKEALFLPADQEEIIQLVIESEQPDAAEFHFYSRAAKDDPSTAWTLHASGKIEFGSETPRQTTLSFKEVLDQLEAGSATGDFYSDVFKRGLEYGPEFQAVRSITTANNRVIARIKLSEELAARASAYQIHPVLADACFQLLLAALPGSNQDTYLPTLIENIQMYSKPSFNEELYGVAIPRSDSLDAVADITLFNKSGDLVMSVNGLRMQRIAGKQEDVRELLYEIEWMENPITVVNTSSKHVLVFSDQTGVAQSLVDRLNSNAYTHTLVVAGSKYEMQHARQFEIDPMQPAHFERLLTEIEQPIQDIVHLWSLDCNDAAPSTADSNQLSILHLVQALAQADLKETPRLWIVTRATQSVPATPEPVAVSQAAVWGMGAVIANEFPNLHLTRVDLSSTTTDIEGVLLAQLLQAGDEEDQVALRNGQRYVARLKRDQRPAGDEAEKLVKRNVGKGQSFRVQITTSGILDGLSLKPMLRWAPKSGQVEIAVKATGLNFMNVMAALGILPGYDNGVGPLGIECAGVVTRVGEGVNDLQAGDEVAAIAFDSLASHALADAHLVVKKPPFMSFAEAASIPIAYVTAYYAFHYLGRLQAGERVLIHAATGGVGLAAIELAKRAGAEIFATAGSDEKRKLLREMGIQHIMDSRSLAFADDVMKITNGEGVDMVLNSLAGSAITKGLEILKPYGRFMEIGKRDIYGNSKVGLLPFQKNLSYFAIDLDKMSRERPDIVGRMLQDVFQLLETREVAPLPINQYPVSKASDAFRLMAQAKHIGKIAITMDDPNAAFEFPAGSPPVRADGTYLITGGLGDLGLTFAQWLATQGARHLVLLGRSKPSETAQQVILELQSSGVNAVAAQVDVTNLAQLTELFSTIQGTLPPLRGVIHAAGLLADGTVLQMDGERFGLALAPKVLGAWNLHTLTADQSLDFFILFSSVAATLGMLGQVNYAAGNAFLDALAHFRHAQKLPALSINWGPWSEIGLAATQTNRGERLMQQGLKSITPSQGLEAMSLLMATSTPQISVMNINAQQWCKAQPAAARSSLFKEFSTATVVETVENKPSGKDIRAKLMDIEPGRQRRMAFDLIVREQVSQVLHLPAARIPSDKPLKTLGMDSLMSIELRNRMEDELGVLLSASLIWNYPTVNALALFLAEKMGIALDGQEQAAAVQEAEAKPASDELDGLDKDELEALLAEELSAIDDTLKGSGFDTETGR